MLLPPPPPATGPSGRDEAVSSGARALFSSMDADGNGVLSVDEVREQLRDLGAAADDAEALMQLAAEEERAAASDDGRGEDGPAAERGITLHEFSRFLRKVGRWNIIYFETSCLCHLLCFLFDMCQVSLVGALDRLDKEQLAGMMPPPSSNYEA